MSTQQIGTTAFTVAGQLVGSYLGGPIGGAIGGLAGGLIGSLIFGRSDKSLVPEIQVMNSSYGRPIPLLYGTARLPGMMFWQSSIETGHKSIGKGGGGSSGNRAYAYWQSAAIAFCEGPAAIKKLFLDGRLFFDATALNPQELTKYRFTIRTYYGYPDQIADPLMTTWVNSHVLPGNSCPDYHGLAYLVFDRPDLAHFGNRFPQVTAIWTTQAQRQVLYQELKPWDPTLTHPVGASPISLVTDAAGNIQVDWTRMVAYATTGYTPPSSYMKDPARDQFTIRAFDLVSGNQIMQTNWQTLFGTDATGEPKPPEMLEVEPYDIATGQCYGISICQGGHLYVWGGFSFTSKQWIATVNPDTLEKEHIQVFNVVGANPYPYFTEFVYVLAFTIITAEGAVELVFGAFDFTCFVVDPSDGSTSPLRIDEIADRNTVFGNYTTMKICLGANDATAGTQEVWAVAGIWASYILDAPVTELWVYKGVVKSGTDVTWEKVGTITPDMYGHTPPPHSDSINYGPGLDWIAYYKGDDSIVIKSGWGLFRWFHSSNTCQVYANGQTGDLQLGNGQALVNDLGYMTLVGESWIEPGFYNIDLATGRITHFDALDQEIHLDRATGFVAGPTGDSYGNMILYTSFYGTLIIAYVNRMVDSEYPISEIIRDLCHRVGVTDDMIDVSLVTQTTPGYVVQENKSAGMCISDLLHVYQIDMIESDFKLKFIPRGQATAATISQADLISVDPSDPAQYWRVKQAQQQEMPLQMVVRYQDPSLDFESGATYARRTALPVPTVWSKRRTTIDLPVIVTAVQARQIVDRWLWTMWAERFTAETTLSPKYLYLDPGDNITVTFDNGDVINTRIEEETVGTDLSLHVQLAYEDSSVYNPAPNLRGPSVSRLPQTIQAAPFGALLQFNVPLLQDSDDTGGVTTRIYYAVGAYGSGWQTGELFISTDMSVSWQDYAAISAATDWGHAANKLADTPSKFATDIANTVTISPMSGSAAPENCSYDQMLAGINGALLGQEIIQWQFATDNHNGTFTLSNLLRGRRGTEWATGTHETGDLFIPLVLGKLGARAQPLTSIGVQALYKLVPQGRFIDQAATNPFTYRGYDLKPYAPVLFKRTPTGADLKLSWTRRTRLAGLLLDGTDTAPLYESSEAYEAYVLADASAIATFNPDNPASYRRAYTGLTVPYATYTAAQMTADGFNRATSTLYLAVYQISGAIGRGFQGYAAVPAY